MGWWIIKVKLSNMKYAANFPVTINNNNTISLFDTGGTISCMSKACFDKLQPKPALVQTHGYKVNGAKSNSFGPVRTNSCILKFPKKISTAVRSLQTPPSPYHFKPTFSTCLPNWNLLAFHWSVTSSPRTLIYCSCRPCTIPFTCLPNFYLTYSTHISQNNLLSHNTTKNISNSTHNFQHCTETQLLL